MISKESAAKIDALAKTAGEDLQARLARVVEEWSSEWPECSFIARFASHSATPSEDGWGRLYARGDTNTLCGWDGEIRSDITPFYPATTMLELPVFVEILEKMNTRVP